MNYRLCLRPLACLIWIVVVFRLAGLSQDPADLRGPVLGFVPDRASIRPILGIPGAALLGRPIALAAPIRLAAVSPSQDQALVVLDSNPDVVAILRFGTATFERIELPDVNPKLDVIAFSPTGSAAIVYDRETGFSQSLLLKPAPQLLFTFDASTIEGQLTTMAVADSGRFVVARFAFEGGSETWLVTQNERVLVPFPEASALTFVPGSHEVLLGDGRSGQIARVSQAESMRSTELRVTPVHTGSESLGVIDLAIALDGRRIFGLTESGRALVIETETGKTASLPCYCTGSGLFPLRGRAVFRLSDPEKGPIAVLDAGTPASAPRVVLMPSEVVP